MLITEYRVRGRKVQKCKSAYGLCKSAKVRYRVLRLYRVGSGLRPDLGRQLGPHVVLSLPCAQELTRGEDGEAVDGVAEQVVKVVAVEGEEEIRVQG